MPTHDLPGDRQALPQSRRYSLPRRGPSSGDNDFLVVGIGASAGGLDAAAGLMKALPAKNGMAFILIQHLDPTHHSMMADLLASHTSMVVGQAEDGMRLEPDHLYVIPPGTYLSVANAALRLSEPQARHGARLPFDFLLHSLAEEYGDRAVCVILSGTGADGSLGLKAVKHEGGLVIAQDPDEAGYDGMPRNAISTDSVDLVLPVAGIPDALARYDRRMALPGTKSNLGLEGSTQKGVSQILELLRTRTAHDFTLYKSGTLQRRIERRMAMAAIERDGVGRYLDLLSSDADELDLLAKDLLINVTSFFRDRQVFDFLATKIIPNLVRNHPPDRPLRIWIAGCSSGEETYSLAMLFREEIAAAARHLKLQVFASDVDPDAVASAREGLYPTTIETEISPERLARFFVKEEQGYRVLPELRAMVVFTVQDVLADPPFSRLDLVSCRNLLIYLLPEAQEKVIALFHFALREGGFLLLGNSETMLNAADRFEVISKPERLYRRIGRTRPGDLDFALNAGDGLRVPARMVQNSGPSRQAALAELCRRMVLETYAPAAILINREHECLYYLGQTDRYLHVPAGSPTRDLLAMARQNIRIKLRSAIQRASQENVRTVVAGVRSNRDDGGSFRIVVQPIQNGGEDLLLICFIDEPASTRRQPHGSTSHDAPRIAELEEELEATRIELTTAIRNLETSSEEQRIINEEALSVNEEYQSTNEELVTSKEELQSLNEELTALNSQLQETLERQRTTYNDLQNVLYSTDVATLFLDTNLNIRFFTPATKALFSVIPTDVGRPLADLSSLATDSALLADARTVLDTLHPIEREIKARNGSWYLRRILPYRTQDNGVEGVVITFADITERRHVTDALETARREAQRANIAKSRFLAAASHDLRQPLQALSLMRSILEKSIREDRKEEALVLVARLDDTTTAMSGMLNSLLDINELEVGTVHAEMASFPVADLLARLREEFTYHAQAQGLVLRVIPCGLSIYSDPRLLEQMIRNLLSNALKYTKRGRVLLGCRRHRDKLSMEIWDTGVGIPNEELQAIFDEYHQLDNAARERGRGLGLGLSVVRHLGELLDHPVHVRSRPGKGSVFAVEVMLQTQLAAAVQGWQSPQAKGKVVVPHRSGAILIIEDDPEVRDLLDLLLAGDGHQTATAADGPTALGLITRGTIRPDLVLADYNLPNNLDGLAVIAKLRTLLHRNIPAIILTGDISAATLSDIANHDCIQLNKPVRPKELIQTVQHLLHAPRASMPTPSRGLDNTGTSRTVAAIVFVVDDDRYIRDTICKMLEEDGYTAEGFATCEAFLEAYHPGPETCLLIDAYLPGMSGLELLRHLDHAIHRLPAIMITGNSDVPMAVEAMKAGALDFIEKPFGQGELLTSVKRALERSRDASALSAWREAAASHIATLTKRQRQIMDLVLSGHPSKNIAADLGISQRTVENHRAAIMRKTGSKSLPALARIALAATSTDS
ncbi:chemotaxis protein CheB [Labrys sedimenti]|uniref:chemotaxis protein CheB n=1 Tax=Labrys sedimenti TaxID=3106036 RepID=UPI002ACA0CC8|nr:chemotaxis protein CheB [Labrys sp. ZIDIC5]MDZ5454565.1 CheR family methyltransferase [Labrys sp. ZIDIC5]